MTHLCRLRDDNLANSALPRRAVSPLLGAFLIVFAGLSLAGCQGAFDDGAVTYEPAPSRESRAEDGGLSLLGGANGVFGSGASVSGGRIGVNALLWRAALDTVSFMPLGSADPFGGVIITEWYSDPATPSERFKTTVYILDQRLRADAVRVSLFRQVRSGNRWADAPVSDGAARQLEDQILTRARQMRIAASEG